MQYKNQTIARAGNKLLLYQPRLASYYAAGVRCTVYAGAERSRTRNCCENTPGRASQLKDKKTVICALHCHPVLLLLHYSNNGTGPGLERAFNSCVYCRIPLFSFGYDRLTHRLILTRVETRDRESCGDLTILLHAACESAVYYCDQPAQP